MFLQIDGTFVLQIINFALFYLILRVAFIVPVNEALRKRRAYINGVAADYERAMETVKTLQGQADEKKARARREAAETFSLARAEANSEADLLGAAYAERAATLIDQAQATVAKELAAAKAGEEPLARELAAMLLDRAVATVGGT